jgi:hypothetical protein
LSALRRERPAGGVASGVEYVVGDVLDIDFMRDYPTRSARSSSSIRLGAVLRL